MQQEPSGGAQQPRSSEKKMEEPSSKIPNLVNSAEQLKANNLALVQSAMNDVHQPDVHALAKALGIDLAEAGDESANSSSYSLRDLGDLDGDGVSEFAFNKIQATIGEVAHDEISDKPPSRELLMLAWDGAKWRASQINTGFEPYELHVLSSLIPGSRQIALVVFSGTQEIPYPSIYQVKDHAVSLLWDGRADDSRYEGHPQGKIEFRNPEQGGAPLMLVSGRADPGLLQFPPDGGRGFGVRAQYIWDGKSYVPNKTEYSDNEDYTLYRFISALHLHDFRSAYALIDPPKFLKVDTPSLEIFRKQIEGLRPEFLDDQIFEAREPTPGAPSDFAFELFEEDQHYVYQPSFGGDFRHLLTGLERREEAVTEP